MTYEALVIGGGPAGLMATEQLAERGLSVLVAEAKPSVGRKFLMAGKSGLNLTKAEPFDQFMSYYDHKSVQFVKYISHFCNTEIMRWAESLGQDVFTGSSGRVFPKVMKASPLLRAWLRRLDGLGVRIATRWRWTGWDKDAFVFETPDGVQKISPKVTVLALGGKSWARLGSDGAWAAPLMEQGVEITPFQASNVGLQVDWSPHMQPHFGQPVKSIRLTAGDRISRGEIVISARGIEGGGIYSLSPPLREGAPLSIDLLPDLTEQEINQRIMRAPRKQSMSNRLRRALRLPEVKQALLMEFGRPLPDRPGHLLKHLPINHQGLRPMDEAISTAGGVSFDQLNDDLMLNVLPGVFCAGEMLDWDAPTGGYLLTACFATGRWAGQAAARYALD